LSISSIIITGFLVPDIRAPMAANLGLVANAADREAHELASHCSRNRLPERRLADARRSNEAQDRTGQLLLELADGQVLDDAILDLLEIVVILVENLARFADLDVVRRLRAPRQLHEPIEIGANHAVFGTCLRHFGKPVELTISRLFRVLRHLGFVDLGAQLVVFGDLRIDLAQFFLNRTQLLAQVELALILLHLALNVALNLVAEFDHFEFLGEQQREFTHPARGVTLFEQRLPIGRLQTHRRCDEIRQHAGIGDVLNFHLHLARRLRQVGEQFLEEAAEITLHGNEFLIIDGHVGELGVCGYHVRLLLREFFDLEDALAGDDTTNRSVGNFEHLLDDADGADALDVVRPRILDLAILEHGQADRLAFAQGFLDQENTRLLDDRERNHGVRE
jgi:hypothetical protein